MKKLGLIIAILAIGFTTAVHAQITMDVHAGFNNTHIKGDGLQGLLGDITDTRIAPQIGVGLDIPIPNAAGFSFNTGLDYRQDRFITSVEYPLELWNIDIPVGVSAESRIHQIALPALLKYTQDIGDAEFYAAAGPMVSYMMDADMIIRAKAILDFKITEFDIPTDGNVFRPWNVYGVLQAGLKFPFGSGKLGVGAHYLHGFTSITDVPVVELNNYQRNWGANVSYSFPLSR